MKLFICEKPAQARDIARVLFGKDVKNQGFYYEQGNVCVTYAVGHILEMAVPEDYIEGLKFWDINPLPIIPEKWKLKIAQGFDKQVGAIRGLVNRCDSAVIATDAGREGELIARSILYYCGFDPKRKKLERLWIQSLDDKSIREGLAKLIPAEQKEGLYWAGLARQRADWLVGMNCSRVFTAAYKDRSASANDTIKDKDPKSKPKNSKSAAFSIGRVQTPTLALVVRRDLAIANFKPKNFYTMVGTFKHTTGEFTAQLKLKEGLIDADGHCVDEKLLKAVADKCRNEDAVIAEAITEAKKTLAPLPYDLAALQQEASRKLKISVKQVLDVAQVLYEKYKIISYPRGDCEYLDENQFAEVHDVVGTLVRMDPALAELVPKLNLNRKGRAWNSAQVAKHDHHAIIPKAVDGKFDWSVLSKQELAVFKLVRDRYLMQFAADYEFDATRIVVECVGETFIATGKVERVLGWKSLFESETEEESSKKSDKEANQKLPHVEQGDAVRNIGCDIKTGKTTAPKPFTEATLLEAMINIASTVTDPVMKKILSQSKGLGTPATRSGIFERLFEIGALQRQGTKVVSTEKGRMMINKLSAEPKTIALTQPETTALWEFQLDQLAKGTKNMTYDRFMTELEKAVCGWVEHGKSIAK